MGLKDAGKGFLRGAAKYGLDTLESVIRPFAGELQEAFVDTAQGELRSVIAGQLSVQEWADLVVDGIDDVKDRIVDEGGLRYIGGKLTFSLRNKASQAVVLSFHLYFLDESERWHKTEAESTIPISNFTMESLSELKSEENISFEVE